MKMKITIDSLYKTPKYGDRAREDVREWFAETFPKGATIAQAVKACPRGDWLIWVLWNFNRATIEQVIMLGCAAGRLSLRFSRPEDLAVNTAALDAADSVADNNTEKTRSAARAAAMAASRAAARTTARAAAGTASWGAAGAAYWAAAGAAARGARAAARTASWAAAWAAEHLACADAIRKLMRTARYKRAGRGSLEA